MQYTIYSNNLTAVIEEAGAQIVSLKHNGKEVLWQNQTGDWDWHAPLLFPVCGRCSMIVDNQLYPLSKHGFARKSHFLMKKATKDSVTFALSHNADTLAVYPYPFVFAVTYTLCESTVKIDYSVTNPDSKDIYFHCGGHEAQYIADGFANYHLVFEKDEQFDSLSDDDGILNGKSKSLGSGKILPLTMECLKHKGTVILGSINSRSVTLARNDGTNFLTTTFPNFSNLLLWSPDGMHSICIEPWTNLPDNNEDITKEFSHKKNVQRVMPQSTVTLTRTITYH